MTRNAALVRTNCSSTTLCDVVVGDIYSVLPFGHTMVVREITGAVLWQALEHSVAQMPNADGRFLQIAGFKFEWKQSNPAGSRVQSVTLLDAAGRVVGSIARDFTRYKVVTNDFTNAGGDGYTTLKETNASPSREVMADVLRDYVKTKSLISPSHYPGGRIVMVP
jgi:5'-nucleotidase